jgi:hypothetical protein
MKSLLKLSTLLAAALFSAVVLIPFLPFAAPQNAQFRFEATTTSNVEASVQFFFDLGQGIVEANSARATVVASAKPQPLSFAMPAGVYRGFRFDPLDRTHCEQFRVAGAR